MADRSHCPTVVFTPSGHQGPVAVGTTVLEAARILGADLDTVCGGRGICGRCQVEPSFGEFPKWAITSAEAALGPRGPVETDYHGRRPLIEGHRLGCVTTIEDDVVIDVPAQSQIHKQVVRKDVRLDGLVIDPMVSLHYLEPRDRDEADGTPIDERVLDELADQWATDPRVRTRLRIAPSVLPRLHTMSRALTVARRDHTVVAAWPGFVDRILGLAVDIGSTTVAGHLCDLTSGEILATAGRMNPQIRFGEDLMSRVSYVMMNPGGAQRLTDAIRRALNELITELLEAVDDDQPGTGFSIPSARDRVMEVVLVGNPIMHHIVLGIDPTPLGQAPFPLATADSVTLDATDLDLDLVNARVYVGPCIAGHVGADTAAAICSEQPNRSRRVQLLVDVGTNAEIVLGNQDRLFAASSPTGPAFEGAQISSGQRATAGAVERVRIDRATLEPRIRVIGVEPWSDEPGFDAAVNRTGVTGICGSGIIEAIGELFLAGVVDAQGVITPVAADHPGHHRIVADGRTWSYRLTDTITVTQGDVRAIQLAKAALRAGVDLLLERSGWTTVDEIRLAGAFGAHIDPLYAMVLGLLPDCRVEAVTSAGNAAGSGALRVLLSGLERSRMEDTARRVTKIETATEPRFQELFVAALALPHAEADNRFLARSVDLPDRPTAGAAPGRRRGAARRAREQKGMTDERDPNPGNTGRRG